MDIICIKGKQKGMTVYGESNEMYELSNCSSPERYGYFSLIPVSGGSFNLLKYVES